MNEAQFSEQLPIHNKELPQQGIANLFIAVHPSFLIENPNRYTHTSSYGEPYKTHTRIVGETILDSYTPKNKDDVTLVMPHEEPSLSSWRRAKKADVVGDTMWPLLYKRLKRRTQYPGNVMVVKDLLDKSWDRETPKEEIVKDTEEKISFLLNSKGLTLTSATQITIGGEFKDLCVHQVARRLLSLPNVRSLRIDNFTTVNSAYHSWDSSTITAEEVRKEKNLIERLKAEFDVVEENNRFMLIKKRGVLKE